MIKPFFYRLFSDKKKFDDEDKKRIKRDIEAKYNRVAESPIGKFSYPTGREALVQLGYPKAIINSIPGKVLASYCGTGNPFRGIHIEAGETIFDFGCGAGVDTIFAAKLTGDRGRVVGGDIVPSMLDKAKSNQKTSNTSNLEFILLDGKKLPFEDNIFDKVISNSVINLVPDKKETLDELYRCLKAGGEFLVVDQVFRGIRMKKHEDRVKSWFQ